MLPNSPETAPRTWKSILIRHLFGLLVCIGLPALVTAIAPVSWLKFQRQGDRVAARAETCLLFVIPFRTVSVEPVIAVGERTIEGRVTWERRRGKRDLEHRSESEGFLTIKGPKESVEVQVTPFNLESVVEKVDAFLKDPAAAELKLFVVANWKFSVVAGGFVSLLTVLYLVGVVVAAGRQIILPVRVSGSAGK